MSRKVSYIVLAVTVLVVGALVTRWQTHPPVSRIQVEAVDDGSATAGLPLKRPPMSVAELAVLTRRTDVAVDRSALSLELDSRCGDAAACDAIRATLLDERATTLRIVGPESWPTSDLALETRADASSLPRRGDAGAKDDPRRWPTVIVVRVASATSPRALALRTASAVTAALAKRWDGVIADRLLGRIEDAAAFARHALVEPLGAPVFRADRVTVNAAPAGDGVLRLRTAGLVRWGAPDVEAASVPESARYAMTQVVLGVAAALANGAQESPVAVRRSDVVAPRVEEDTGAPDGAPGEDARPPVTEGGSDVLDVDLVSVEAGHADGTDFVARIEPADGEGPVAYLALAERFFGAALPAPPDDAQERAEESHAQDALSAALERWADAGDTKLWVRLPFEIPGGGQEALWVRVSGADGGAISGTIDDDPLAATDVSRGDRVSRPRSDVRGVRLR